MQIAPGKHHTSPASPPQLNAHRQVAVLPAGLGRAMTIASSCVSPVRPPARCLCWPADEHAFMGAQQATDMRAREESRNLQGSASQGAHWSTASTLRHIKQEASEPGGRKLQGKSGSAQRSACMKTAIHRQAHSKLCALPPAPTPPQSAYRWVWGTRRRCCPRSTPAHSSAAFEATACLRQRPDLLACCWCHAR